MTASAKAGILPGIDIMSPLRGSLYAIGNIFTNVGTAVIANRVIQSGTAPKFIGWGIGTSGPLVGDTALGSESLPTSTSRGAGGTETRTTTTLSNDTYTVTGTVTAASSLAITEAGTFDAATVGNLVVRAVFAAINVISGDSVAFTFGLQFLP